MFWSSAAYFLRALRWRVLLNVHKDLSSLDIFWANMAGYLGNTILPARMGEIVRAVYISRRDDLPVAFALATGITERLVDLATLIVIGTASALLSGTISGSMQEAFRGFVIIAVVGVGVVVFLPYFQNQAAHTLYSMTFLPIPIRDRLVELLRQFSEGMKAILHFRRGLPFAFYTALIWLMDGAGMVVLAASLGAALTLPQSLLLIASLGISSALPSTPGYVGVYQFVAVTVLAPFGITRESALALILLVQFLNLIVVSVWGGVGLWLASRTMEGMDGGARV